MSASRCFSNHPGTLLPRLRHALPRSLLVTPFQGLGAHMELLAEAILHFLVAIHRIRDDARVRAYEGEGEGVEDRLLCSGGLFGCNTNHVLHLSQGV